MRKKREENRATATEPECDPGCQQSVYIQAKERTVQEGWPSPLCLNDIHALLKTALNS